MTTRMRGVWAAVVMVSVLFACGEQAPVVTATGEFDHLDADAIVIGGEHTFTNEEGLRAAFLAFDTAYQWRDSTDMALRGVDLTVYTQSGSERARVTSREGTLDPRGERMTALGDVVLLVPGENRTLESGELHYDPELGQIWSDSSFVMTHGNQTLRGSSFISDLEFSDFRARGTDGG